VRLSQSICNAKLADCEMEVGRIPWLDIANTLPRYEGFADDNPPLRHGSVTYVRSWGYTGRKQRDSGHSRSEVRSCGHSGRVGWIALTASFSQIQTYSTSTKTALSCHTCRSHKRPIGDRTLCRFGSNLGALQCLERKHFHCS
jgi:hypothetical protein